jgi:DNA topoisomerase VI subunit B
MVPHRTTETEAQLEVDFTGAVEDAAPGAIAESAPVSLAASRAKPRPARRPAASQPARAGTPAPAGRRARAAENIDIATQLASQQREISVSEFFAKNRHLLGFDNPAKALLTTVKEAVDNALDACEDANLVPEIRVQVTQVDEERYRVAVEDNGPGIVSQQVPKIFGKLLYGSKFHTLRQSRGQQGIGISAAGMYGLLTTGKPVVITSRTSSRSRAHHFELAINTKKNAPDVLVDEEVEWEKPHGTRVEITLEGIYKKGRHSIEGYLKQVAVANPHATIIFEPPAGEGGPVEFVRTTKTCPVQPKAIRPHPHGVELGVFLKMLQDTPARNLRAFLQSEFSRVGSKVIDELAREIASAGLGITVQSSPKKILARDAEGLHKALGRVKIMAPPTDCLSPIGEELLLLALKDRVAADFYTAVTRPPSVYRGNPFQIEVGLAYGGELPGDELITLYRYANRVPLQYQQSACAMTKAVVETPWRNYKIAQSRGALPAAPLVVVLHIASVWVPFTSESKEAVAHYPEIVKEIRLALQESGRRLAAHISRHRRLADAQKKSSYITKYIPQIGIALQEILGLTDKQRAEAVETLTEVLERSRGL